MRKFTIHQFNEMFPDDDACLDFIRDVVYPDGITCRKCGRVTKHHRLANRKAYSCQECGTHVYPLAGTIFAKSTTPLKSWFYAMYLLGSTRCGISAKQLERELGVTYKTAWRMFKQLRSLMAQDAGPLSGRVEMDETYYGGKPRLSDREWNPDGSVKMGRTAHSNRKQMVFGAVERGGRIRAEVVGKDERGGIARRVDEFVMPESIIYTDEYVGYDKPGQAFAEHHRIRHAARIYVDGDVHTQTIEGFWSLLKNGIRGVYHSVSAKHLQDYVDEYAFRFNHRDDDDPMFTAVADRMKKVRYGRYGRYAPLG